MKQAAALALIGPTASGKTALALALAHEIPLEIISMDSALIYRGMDIGTAKPTHAEQAQVPHHLIDICDPTETYSAAQFVTDCVRLVQEIRARDKLPLIVGGTMMYYHALSSGLHDLPAADERIRQQMQAIKDAEGIAALYAQLQQHDPLTAARLKPTDSQRIERALEIFYISGKPLSAHTADSAATPPLNLRTLALLPEPRAHLHQHIASRFQTMLDQGFLDEVRRLQQDYPSLNPDLPSMRSVGYRQAWAHLAGEVDYDTFVAQGIAATRQLAKRQITWLRRFAISNTVNPYDPAHHALAQLRLMAEKRTT